MRLRNRSSNEGQYETGQWRSSDEGWKHFSNEGRQETANNVKDYRCPGAGCSGTMKKEIIRLYIELSCLSIGLLYIQEIGDLCLRKENNREDHEIHKNGKKERIERIEVGKHWLKIGRRHG